MANVIGQFRQIDGQSFQTLFFCKAGLFTFGFWVGTYLMDSSGVIVLIQRVYNFSFEAKLEDMGNDVRVLV